MKRISPTGCGYSLTPGVSYTCSGIPKFNPLFGETTLSTATSADWLTKIDNYNNVPQSMEGFIMTLAPILDMSGGISIETPEVPELECRVNFDPFTSEELSVLNTEEGWSNNPATETTGFLDMFQYGGQTNPPNGIDYKSRVYVEVNGHTHNLYANGLTMLPAFSNGTDVYMLKPGALEPMVDTSFAPINVDVNPPDLDGPNTAIAILNKWRHEADLRFRDLYSKIRPWIYDDSNVNGLINLEAAQNMEGECQNFQIKYMYDPELDPPPLVQLNDGVDPTAGRHFYTIGGGTVYVNGDTSNPVEVRSFFDPDDEGSEEAEEHGSLITAPFQAYLEYDITGNTASIKINNSKFVLARRNNCLYYYIGEVKTVRSKAITIEDDGTDYMLYKLIQGDCITDITIGGGDGKGYEGPFMVSLAGSTVYLHEGDEIPATTDVVGGPTNTDIEHPQTASKDYLANIYSITDGAHSIPCDPNNHCYAGYSIITGLSYNKEPTYTFKVDKGTDASVYMLYTRSGDSWSGSYQQRAGTSAPATDMVEINGVSMEASAVRIGAVIGGTTGPGGQLIGGATVTSIDGSTDTTTRATNGSKIETMVAGATASTSYDVPDRYLVPIGHVSGGAIGQIQYGDIFIDVQNIPEPEPGPGGDSVYSGPFHVIDDADSPSGFSVKGISSDHTSSDEPAAGMIYYNGADLNTVEAAYVAGSSKLTSGSVYAHIILTKNGSGNYVATLGAYNTSDSYTASVVTVYSIRLAEITGSTTAKQIHYGDIYLFGEERDSGYTGPFTVTVDGGTFAITCAACGSDDNNHPIIGWYSVNGQGDTAITGPYTGEASVNGYVFFHYSAEGAEINTDSSQSDPSDYVVRLARITGGVASQLHYGNIQIDGRWS